VYMLYFRFVHQRLNSLDFNFFFLPCLCHASNTPIPSLLSGGARHAHPCSCSCSCSYPHAPHAMLHVLLCPSLPLHTIPTKHSINQVVCQSTRIPRWLVLLYATSNADYPFSDYYAPGHLDLLLNQPRWTNPISHYSTAGPTTFCS
jgi:hypothetical protein